jgi:hypothetical protein
MAWKNYNHINLELDILDMHGRWYFLIYVWEMGKCITKKIE